MRYSQVKDGDTIAPVMRGYRMVCCCCSACHVFNFKVSKAGQLSFTVRQDRRATAAMRRRLAKAKSA